VNYNFFNTIIFSGIVYGFIFCITIVLNKKYDIHLLAYLFLTVLSLTLSNLQYWLLDVGIYEIPDIYYIQFELLIVPFFYLFMVRYLSLKKFKFELLFFIPFVLGMSYQIWSINNSHIKQYLSTFNLVVEAATILYNATLILFLFREVWLFEKNKDLNRINVSTKWIIHSISIGGSLVIFWIGATFILKTQTEFAFNIYYPLWIGISALVLFLGTRANMELNIVSDRKRIRKIKQVNSKTSNKLVSRKQKSSQNTYYEIINEIVNSKLYLDPTISLNSVADKFRFSGNYISQLFGKHSGFGFNDFINKLRVEEAKKMLNDKKFSNYTTVAIGLESGFNSKSTFFAVFKKHTGVTPSEFKNSLKK